MRKYSIAIENEDTRGIGALEASGTPAAFCDVVRVELSDAVLLYISGATPVDENGEVMDANSIWRMRWYAAHLVENNLARTIVVGAIIANAVLVG